MNSKKNTGTRTQNSVKNLFASLGGQLLITIMRFVTRTIFIATLGKTFLGINGYFADIINMLSITELGFDTAINFKLYKPLATGDDKRVRVLLKFYKVAYRVVGLVILGIGLILIPLLPVLIQDYGRLEDIGINAPLIFILFLLQSVSSYLFFAYRSAIMKANQKKYILDVAGYVITVLTNVVQILVLIFLKDFIIYTATVIVFNILQNLLFAWITQRRYPEYFIKEPDSLSRAEVKDLFKDVGALFLFKVNATVLKATDNMVIGGFLGLEVVGLYSNYLLIFTTIRAFLRKLYSAVKASTGNLFAVESIEKKYLFFNTMNFLTIVFYGMAAVGIAVCANELINVWIGPDYLIAQPFPFLIGIEILISGFKQNMSQIRTVTGVFQQMWYRPLLGIFINIGVSIALVQVMGIYGVIIGTLTADMLTSFIVDPKLIYQYSFENYRPVREFYIQLMIYVAILFGIYVLDFWICSVFLTGYGWISVIVHILIVAISVPAIFILIYRKSAECRYLLSIIRNLARKRKGKKAA